MRSGDYESDLSRIYFSFSDIPYYDGFELLYVFKYYFSMYKICVCVYVSVRAYMRVCVYI